MKLLVKTSLHYLWLSSAILFIAGTLLFTVLKMDIISEIREQLELSSDLVVSELEQGNTVAYPMVDIVKLPSGTQPSASLFKDTLIHDPRQNVAENYYMLTEEKLVKGQLYRIKVLTTYIGWDEYLKTIATIFVVIIFLLLVAGSTINYFLNRKLWLPFITNMNKLKQHSLKSSEQLMLEHSNIEEFKQLNEVLLEYNSRATQQYRELQEFSENASHELQTPISIIRTRLENLSQMPLEPEAAGYLHDAKASLERLRRVNKGLLLLARLSNNQFDKKESINVSDILLNQIDTFNELFHSKNLVPDMEIEKVHVEGNAVLVDILFSNLISNLLKYSAQPGRLSVIINTRCAVFSNPGEPLPFNQNHLFERFKRGKQGIGLGLAIVKQVCVLHGWTIQYRYINHNHQFTIHWVNTA